MKADTVSPSVVLMSPPCCLHFNFHPIFRKKYRRSRIEQSFRSWKVIRIPTGSKGRYGSCVGGR